MRWMISPIIVETGPKGTQRRPLLAKLIDDLGLGPSVGQPLASVMPLDGDNQDRCLCLVNVKNFQPLLTDGRFDDMPDFPLDGKVNAINAATKNRIKARLVTRGFTQTQVDDWFERGDGYRDAIRGIGRTIQPAFDENTITLVE